ncbi:RagB/SusD family nutrient uptake outer membrane protein [Chitinophaga sp. sic0106]|uniref:RagB/SusD family nutrient uptake outer membrane protein n=1 Tax=Chitinophaga sp. sic0106 TaxID=2854785 RepID=UPI001C480DF1|nr:RagB/SusD family nutrient uptake outer membrane protein [Chitinophaga sp. sic0106]MBV7533376.1 RagB/SusD family nutrient uptake outer membrane protein [Chitinophaga sp. sic0106]
MKIYIYTLALAGLLLSGCKKWMDVKPEDKFLEEQLFSSKQGFETSINGFYLGNTDASLYGGALTMTTMDIMAQLYSASFSDKNPNYAMSSHAYGEDVAKGLIDRIWTKQFANIAGLNNFIAAVDKYGAVMDSANRQLYRGEALGLRAFYYLDLVRMFTPAYTQDSMIQLMPYYTKVSNDISPFYPTKQVMQFILDDLTKAEQLLLASDPAVKQARVSQSTMEFPRTTRNYRMNYYAVKALKARAYMWMGDKPAALAAAKALIAEQSKFPWTTTNDLKDAEYCNKIFATEMIMGFEYTKLLDVFNNNFISTLDGTELLAPESSGAFINQTVFEGISGDYRYQYNWKIVAKAFPTFVKYQDTNTSGFASNRTVSLIRMGEMYLIAAECEPDLAAARGYLNELRIKRNFGALADNATAVDVTTAIMKEYRREFIGEGQLFYFYKRTKAGSIIAGNTNKAITMTDVKYTLPIPLSETTPR